MYVASVLSMLSNKSEAFSLIEPVLLCTRHPERYLNAIIGLGDANIKFSIGFDIFDYNCIKQIMQVAIVSTVLEPISPDDKEQAAVEAFGKALRSSRRQAKFVRPDGTEISVPKSIYRVLEQVIPYLASDNAVSIVPVGHLLTTQEASDLLNISRPYLIKLLDQGVIAFDRSNEAGSHRRIRFADLMQYKHKIENERRQQLRKLTQMSQEAGFYKD